MLAHGGQYSANQRSTAMTTTPKRPAPKTEKMLLPLTLSNRL
jgi:hypothetical protein